MLTGYNKSQCGDIFEKKVDKGGENVETARKCLGSFGSFYGRIHLRL